jgi:5'(3')-deoxyribonucleotidase
MIVGIDIDGVLADFNPDYIQLMIEVSGRDLFPPRPFVIPCWDYPEHYGYTKEEVGTAWGIIKNHPNFWERLNPYPGAKDILKRLADFDSKTGSVYFITTRPGLNSKLQTTKWLMRQGFLSVPSVIVSSKKGPIAAGLGLDALIDDKTENCIEVTSHCAGCKVYMLNQSWNAEFTDLRSIKRIDTVSGFLDEIGL